jgi:hypothetical protein
VRPASTIRGRTPPPRLVAKEEAEALARALDSLPDDTREVLTLYYEMREDPHRALARRRRERRAAIIGWTLGLTLGTLGLLLGMWF